MLPGRLLRCGDLALFEAGQGAPVLLVHSINAAASAAEWQPTIDSLAATRRVFAIDLPGYGHSLRSERDYTPRLMTDALHRAQAEIGRLCGPGAAPLDAVALSLGCEFLARAASEQPQHWGRLALVSPTGLMGTKARRGPPLSVRGSPALHRLLSRGPWAQALFDALTRPAVVRYFLRRTVGGPAIDAALAQAAIDSSRAPGARHAPLAFLSGMLFSADITTVYEALTQPVWVAHGVRGDFTDYRGLAAFSGRPNWQVQVFDSGALPQFDQAPAFHAGLQAFLDA